MERAGRDRNRPARFTKSLQGVVDEIGRDAPQLAVIRADAGHIGCGRNLHRHPPIGSPEPLVQLARMLAEIDVVELTPRVPGEGEHLIRDRRDCACARFDLQEVPVDRRAVRCFAERHRRMPENADQQVVEVVRDAACEHVQ